MPDPLRHFRDLLYASDPTAALRPLYAGLGALANPEAGTRFQDQTALKLGMMWLRHERGDLPLEQLLARAGALTDAANYGAPSCETLYAILNDIEAGAPSPDCSPGAAEVSRLFAPYVALAREGLREILVVSLPDR